MGITWAAYDAENAPFFVVARGALEGTDGLFGGT